MRVDKLYRYPVKGLSPEVSPPSPYEAGALFPRRPAVCDRERAVGIRSRRARASAEDRFPDADAQRGLARLATRYDEATTTLTSGKAGPSRSAPTCRPSEGRADVARFFPRFSAADLRGAPKVLELPRIQLLGREQARGLHHQSRQRPRAGAAHRPARRPAPLPRQSPRRGPPALGRVRPARPRTGGRVGSSPARRQAHPALRRHQCRPRHGLPRPRHPRKPSTPPMATAIAASMRKLSRPAPSLREIASRQRRRSRPPCLSDGSKKGGLSPSLGMLALAPPPIPSPAAPWRWSRPAGPRRPRARPPRRRSGCGGDGGGCGSCPCR